MKVVRILGGFIAGTAAGLAVTAFNKNESKTSQKEFDNSTNEIKQSTKNISNYVTQIKDESKQVKTIIDEVKTLISDFMKDIKPNIEHIQENIQDIQKRGEVITEVVSDITKSPAKKHITPYQPKTQAVGGAQTQQVTTQQAVSDVDSKSQSNSTAK